MEIPSGWAMNRLETLANVQRGKFSARPRNDPQFYGGKIPFVQTGDVTKSGKHLKAYSQTLNEKGLAVSRLFPAGTILMTIAANIGDSTITGYDVAFPDSVVGINCLEGVEPDWLYYTLQPKKHYLDRLSTQNAQKNINLEVLRPLKILSPPLPEQRRIAEILGTWDRAIAATEALIVKSEAQKKALMQQLLTAKRRLPGFDGPWKEVRLTDIAEVTTGASNREDSELVGEFVFFDRSTDVRRSSRYLFDTEAVIVGGEGQEFVPKYFEGKFDLHQRAYAIHTSKQFSIRYLYYIIHYKRHLLRRFAVGSTVASLRMGTFTKIPVPKISFAEQKAVTKILDNSSEQIQALQTKLQTLKTEKAALMQQLLTGKRRVKLTEVA